LLVEKGRPSTASYRRGAAPVPGNRAEGWDRGREESRRGGGPSLRHAPLDHPRRHLL